MQKILYTIFISLVFTSCSVFSPSINPKFLVKLLNKNSDFLTVKFQLSSPKNIIMCFNYDMFCPSLYSTDSFPNIDKSTKLDTLYRCLRDNQIIVEDKTGKLQFYKNILREFNEENFAKEDFCDDEHAFRLVFFPHESLEVDISIPKDFVKKSELKNGTLIRFHIINQKCVKRKATVFSSNWVRL